MYRWMIWKREREKKSNNVQTDNMKKERKRKEDVERKEPQLI